MKLREIGGRRGRRKVRQGDEGSGKGMQKYIGSNQFYPALGLSYAVNIYKVIRQCGSISVRFRMLLNMEQYNRSTIIYFHAKCQFTGKLKTSSTWSCSLSLRSGDSERASHSGGGEEGGGGGGEGEEWRWGGGED